MRTKLVGPVVIPVCAGDAIAAAMVHRMALHDTPIALDERPDGELRVRLEQPVRGREVYLVQSLCLPAGERLLSLALATDAVRRAGAATVTAVLPYVAYARQDHRRAEGEPLAAATIARLVTSCGFDRIVVVDLPTAALEGLLGVPVEHITADRVLVDLLREYAEGAVVVAPDLASVPRAGRTAERLGLPLAIVHTSRRGLREVTTERLIGDVRDRRPLIVDDVIATGATMTAAIDAVVRAGARPDVVVAAVHGVFAPGCERAFASPALRHLVVTDSIDHGVADEERIHRVSIAPLLADVIGRLHDGAPLGDLLAT